MLEAILWAGAAFCVWRTKVRYELSALGIFFGIRLLAPSLYLLCRFGSHWMPFPALIYAIYYYSWWPIYICSALAAFFSIQQIIRSALSTLAGLSSLGVLFFQWAGLLSVVIAITAQLADVHGISLGRWVGKLLISFALCMCLFEVSLLSLLALTSKELGLTLRSRVFGVSLGLALLGITEFFDLALTQYSGAMISSISLCCEVVTVCTLLMLIFYLARPEPERSMIVSDKASTLLRWNQIVREMGVGPPLPVERVPNFMEDVESLVDRILKRNAIV